MRRVPAFALAAFPFLSQAAAWAAPFAIDPDPASPTLSELLDREAAKARVSAAPAVFPMPVPQVAPRPARSEPVIPQGAVTVLTPGARLRDAGTRAFIRR